MPSVYREPQRRPFPLEPFLRASSLHIGAAAAAASLRRDLVERKSLTAPEFDEAYAVARLTPGTNLLAMYALLGQRLAGWRGAVAALSTGTLVPAPISVLVAAAYVSSAGNHLTARAMQGARAGALAVLFWAAVRLIRPQLADYRIRGLVIAVTSLAIAVVVPMPQIVLLLLGGGFGAWLLRREA